MKKLEMLRPERKADSTTIDVATPGQSSTRGQPIHQAPVYAPANNGAPEMRENAEREQAVEDDPHGFRHGLGRRGELTARVLAQPR